MLLHNRDSYDAVVNRLINGITDVFVDFILVDNELSQTHTIVFQLGENKESLYFFDGQIVKPTTLAETQKLLKQIKPFLVLSSEEAKTLRDSIKSSSLFFMPKNIRDKLEAFVDCQN